MPPEAATPIAIPRKWIDADTGSSAGDRTRFPPRAASCVKHDIESEMVFVTLGMGVSMAADTMAEAKNHKLR